MRKMLTLIGLLVLALGVYHLVKTTMLAPGEIPMHVILGQTGEDPMADPITIVGPTDPIKCGVIISLQVTQRIQGQGGIHGTLFASSDESGPWTWCRSAPPRPTVDPNVGCPGYLPHVEPNPFQYSGQSTEFEIEGVSLYGPVWLRVQTYSAWDGEPNPAWLVHVGEPREFTTYYLTTPTEVSGALDEFLEEFQTDLDIESAGGNIRVKALFSEPFREHLGIEGSRPQAVVETALVADVSLGARAEILALSREFFLRAKHPRDDGTCVLVLEDLS